jgi:Reverse transcriptase (RNA-dependent DNA polymerase)
VTKIFTRASAEYNEIKVNKAVEKEIAGLIEQQALEFVLRDDVPEGANVLGTRVVLATNHFGTPDALFKTRMVIQGHLDREAPTIVSDSASLSSFAIRILLVVTLIYNWDAWSVDATQAFLQSDWLSRFLIARLPREMRHKYRRYLFRILKSVYGLKESGSYWFSLYLSTWISVMCMIATVLDPCILFHHAHE